MSITTVGPQGLTTVLPAKTNLQDHARILHARLAWHVHAICPFSCTILHNPPILARSCKKSANLKGNYSCSISCKILHHFLQESCKIVQESCKFVQEKGHIACTCQASLACKILARFLHDLASSFLLGCMPSTYMYKVIAEERPPLCLASLASCFAVLLTTWEADNGGLVSPTNSQMLSTWVGDSTSGVTTELAATQYQASHTLPRVSATLDPGQLQ